MSRGENKKRKRKGGNLLAAFLNEMFVIKRAQVWDTLSLRVELTLGKYFARKGTKRCMFGKIKEKGLY